MAALAYVLATRLKSAAIAAAFGILVAGPASAASMKGPDSVADLVETLQDAVVNISTSQIAKAERPQNLPKLPDGSPMQEFFDEFYKNRQGEAQGRRVQSQGSGFVIDASGIIITNNHVIDGAEDITVTFFNGTKLSAELVGKDAKIDIAVLKVKPVKPLRAVPFGDADKARVGDWVMAIGNPLGLGGSVTVGVVSAKNRDINSGPYDNFLQTDAAINKGNSGGPLFNMAGEVIGINTAIFSTNGGSIGLGFSLPANTAQPVIEQLRSFGEARRGYLGARLQGITDDVAEGLGLKDTSGAIIAGVVEKGPAEAAGVQTGDVVLRFDGKPVIGAKELQRMVADTAVDKEVEVMVLRKGAETAVKVKLGRLEDTDKKPAPEAGRGAAPNVPPVAAKLLGLSLAELDKDSRDKFKIKDKVGKGVVVTEVAANSPAAEKRLVAGDVIVEVGQEAVASADDVVKRIDALKKDGRKRALLLLSNAEGEMRFVTITVE